jgi:putative alpha-1,2-mannosidase
MTAMGLFDVQGHAAANPSFQIGSPLFNKISIKLNSRYYDRDKIVIETVNNNPENIYIQSAELNGIAWENSWFYRQDLINGGKLKLVLGPKPNQSWGAETPPPSMSTN